MSRSSAIVILSFVLVGLLVASIFLQDRALDTARMAGHMPKVTPAAKPLASEPAELAGVVPAPLPPAEAQPLLEEPTEHKGASGPQP